MSEKIDIVRERKDEYTARPTPALVEVAGGSYLTIAGIGSPDSGAFADAIQSLYGMAYTLKMANKRAGRDFTVAPLEGLWWVDGDPENYLQAPRSQWHWKLLIRVPDFIDEDELRQAKETLRSRGKGVAAESLRIERITEGLCVQALHVGPYATEPETLDRMGRLVQEKGLRYHGLHHEIYMSDPRRTVPERARTILRHPVT